MLSTNRTHTQCRCDHLTNFAILMDLHSTPLSAGNGMALTAITYVGCSVSILCLLLAVIAFTFFRGVKVHTATHCSSSSSDIQLPDNRRDWLTNLICLFKWMLFSLTVRRFTRTCACACSSPRSPSCAESIKRATGSFAE